MTGLILRSLRHYWRTNLAVLLGVAVATAVIGGALVVGDSVRHSLRQLTRVRLGQIDHAVHSHRFFTEQLADRLAQHSGFSERFESVAPVLRMNGSLQQETTDGLQLTRTSVWGMDDRAWQMLDHGGLALPVDRDVALSARVADDLQVDVGDDVTLWIEIPSTIPRDSLLGEHDEASQEYVLTVSAILTEDIGAGRLALNPNQQLPANAFVSLDALQQIVELDEGTRRNRRSARVNTLFVSARSDADRTQASAKDAADKLNEWMSESLTLDDLNLRLDLNAQPEYLSLESRQMFVEDRFAEAAERAAGEMGLVTSPVLVYLANWISDPASAYEVSDEPSAQYSLIEMIHPVGLVHAVVDSLGPEGSRGTWFRRYSTYSVIAGLDLHAKAPFGPFEFSSGQFNASVDNEIYLNTWLADDLQVSVGDEVRVAYHTVGAHGQLPETEVSLRVGGVVRLNDSVAADRALTPEVEGFTDVETLQDLNLPFLVRKDRLTDRDEEYWHKHRATPKAFVSLDTAQRLWRSRYGRLTSLRIGTPDASPVAGMKDDFERRFLSELSPRRLALDFRPIKHDGLVAAIGANDFTGLFIAFSFFLIAAATILIGLLFRLGIERRGPHIGLLAAVGFSQSAVRRVFLSEGLVVVLTGGILGVMVAVGYAALMIHGLRTRWIGAIRTEHLELHIAPVSLIAGFGVGVVVAGMVVWWALRQLRRISIRALLHGVTQPVADHVSPGATGQRARMLTITSVIGSATLLLASVFRVVPATEAFSGFSWKVVIFFVVGLLFLTAGLTGLSAWLQADRSTALHGGGLGGLCRLGARNASRHRQRSVYTVGLMACATFVIVAVAAGRRNPTVEAPERRSGNGGYTLVGQSTQPILFDINSQAGREKLDFQIEPDSRDRRLLDETRVMPFAMKQGEDASCLNLYQTRLPTILGVTDAMIEKGGFKFADTPGDNPWRLLTSSVPPEPISAAEVNREVPVYPVLGDMNTLQYSLKKGIGSLIAVGDEKSPDFYLKVTGMFDGSVFQGVLLMWEQNFRELFPDQAGYQYFLVETPADPQVINDVSGLFETQLAAYGLDLERVSVRLQDFLTVQNTYLLTFQTLGGFGLLLGTIGLGTVMLRNVLERRSEIALLRAVGFRTGVITWLVLQENALLLFWGLAAGTFSALLAMLPHLLSTGAEVPWGQLNTMLGAVVVVGMLAAVLAVFEAVRTPIVETLRSE